MSLYDYYRPFDLVIYDDVIPNEKEEETMATAKHWTAYGSKYDTYDKAEAAAKRVVATQSSGAVTVYEAIAVVEAPVPQAEVTKL